MPASLRWAPADPRHHRRPSNTSRQFWLSLLWSLCPFPLSLGACKVLCVPAKTGVPVSPSPVEVLQSNPPGLQGQIPCLSVGTPGWVAWLWVLNLHNSARTSLVLLFSSLGVTHSAGMGCDVVMIVLLPSCCGFFFVFGCGVSFFGGFQHPPVGCSTASCDFGAHRRRWVHVLKSVPSINIK